MESRGRGNPYILRIRVFGYGLAGENGKHESGEEG